MQLCGNFYFQILSGKLNEFSSIFFRLFFMCLSSIIKLISMNGIFWLHFFVNFSIDFFRASFCRLYFDVEMGNFWSFGSTILIDFIAFYFWIMCGEWDELILVNFLCNFPFNFYKFFHTWFEYSLLWHFWPTSLVLTFLIQKLEAETSKRVDNFFIRPLDQN